MFKKKNYSCITLFFLAINFALPLNALDSSGRFQVKKHQNFNLLFDTKLRKKRLFKDQLIIKFKPGTSKFSINKFAKKYNLIFQKKLNENICVFKVSQTKILMRLLEAKNSGDISSFDNDDIDAIDIDEVRKLSFSKSNTQISRANSNFAKDYSSKQWYLENNGKNGLKPDCDVNAIEAWEQASGRGVLVAVIDTGFDLRHPDINYYNLGFDVLNNIANASAPNFSSENHGTAVAGLISAKNNGFGVIGVAPSAQVIPIRMISDDGFVEVSNIIEAHYKAIEMGARIISNSWGSYDQNSLDGEVQELTKLEEEMYEDIYKNSHNGKGTLVIFSSGNNSSANLYNSPEACNKYTLAVGATDSADQRISFSNYGQGLDLVAPGGGTIAIYTTDRGDIKYKQKQKSRKIVQGYQRGDYTNTFSGTSASAPIVAGVAALALSVNLDLSADELKNILIRSASKNLHSRYSFDEHGWNNEVGFGRVDAKQAVNLALKFSS